MRLIIRREMADTDQVIAGSPPYAFTWRLDLHPADSARIVANPPPDWAMFLERQQLTMDEIAAGATRYFTTEQERTTQEEAIRRAVQALTAALGVETLTPLGIDKGSQDEEVW